MPRVVLIIMIVSFLSWTSPHALRAEPPQNLIDLLQEKNVITKEEAESVKKKAKPISPLRGGRVRIGGELELEFVKSERNSDPENNPNARMVIDKIVISPEVQYSDDITFRADIQASGGSGSIKLDEAWVRFKGLPLNSWVTVGLEDVFYKPHRKTESYPILGYAFWQDEDLGVFAGGRQGDFYWKASVTNGRQLDDRRISEDKTKDLGITTDDDDNVDANGNKQIGIGLGIDHSLSDSQEINILPFYYTSRLSDVDVDYLMDISTYGSSRTRSQRRSGINLEYTMKDLTVFGQYMMATDGKMDRDGWYVQPSYKIKCKKRKTFSAVEFLVRYEQYSVDLDHDPADSRTWDRDTTTVAAITDIVKNLRLRTEYYWNMEDTGGKDVKNNELLIQLEAKF